MKKNVFIILLVSLWVANVGSLGHAAAQEAIKIDNRIKRPVTVADSIRMNLIANNDYFDGYSLSDPVANFSRDGSKFVVVLRRGNLDEDSNEYSLLLWWTDKLFQSNPPEVLLKMVSSSYRSAIEEVQWSRDNETLFFLGEHPGEHRQLYAFSIPTRKLHQLTNHPTNILSYSIASDDNTVAYTAEGPQMSIFEGGIPR